MAGVSHIPQLLRILLVCFVFGSATGLARTVGTAYQNARFGYRLEIPTGLKVVNRAADESGVIWQTGTVRVQVSGANNPHRIKPHEYFADIKVAAGNQIVRESQGQDKEAYWYEILYTKDSRQIHRKVFIGAGSIQSVEFSYAYIQRDQQERLATLTLASFLPGDVSIKH
jgi:hypothetical protein